MKKTYHIENLKKHILDLRDKNVLSAWDTSTLIARLKNALENEENNNKKIEELLKINSEKETENRHNKVIDKQFEIYKRLFKEDIKNALPGYKIEINISAVKR